MSSNNKEKEKDNSQSSSNQTQNPPSPRRRKSRDDDGKRRGSTGSRNDIFNPVDLDKNQVKLLQKYVISKMDVAHRLSVSPSKNRSVMLAAFVPDLILFEERTEVPQMKSFEAVVYIADIIGFTALTEAYSLKGHVGTDQLTKTLSSYIGPLAECILRAGGDIIKFAGDSFIAIWRVEDPLNYPETVQKVIDCALYQQEKYGAFYASEVDITVKVKIGIGAGLIYFYVFGNGVTNYWATFGAGVQSASAAEKKCETNCITVHLAAWKFCQVQDYSYKRKKDSYGIDDNVYEVNEIRNFSYPLARGRPTGQNVIKDYMIKRKGNKINVNEVNVPADSLIPAVEIRSLKNFSKYKHKNEAELRKYAPAPVLKKVDDGIPLEFLNESRYVSICFIHVNMEPIMHQSEFGQINSEVVENSFRIIDQTSVLMNGCLTKVIMYDKGLCFLVVFGLPNFIHDNQSANALKFSYTVQKVISTLEHVEDCSVGITSGLTYCGVLGHSKRHEYTVIGRKVNKAARLMAYYPKKVTCDSDTMIHSKLHQDYFYLMESKKLKGITDAGKIYEFFNEHEGMEDNRVQIFDYPLLNRTKEMETFKSELENAKEEFLKFSKNFGKKFTKINLDMHTSSKKDEISHSFWMLIFEGESGIGKSRVLSECIEEAEKSDTKVFSVKMNMFNSTQRYYGLKSILIPAFGMEDLRSFQEREECLRTKIDNRELAANLFLVNEIFHVKFPTHPKFWSTSLEIRHTLIQRILSALLLYFFKNELLLFVIDDAHLMDTSSWENIQYLSKTANVFCVLGLRNWNLTDTVEKILHKNQNNIHLMNLEGIDPSLSLQLACQILEVKAISKDLEKLLQSKSQGVPAWYRQVLKEYLRSETILIVPYESSLFGQDESDLKFCDDKYIQKLRRNFKALIEEPKQISQLELFNRTKSKKSLRSRSKDPLFINPQNRICIVKIGVNILKEALPGSLKEILLQTFDVLDSNEQLILKCASILGPRFSRLMVTRIIPRYDSNIKKYQKAFIHLFDLKILRCASLKYASEKHEMKDKIKNIDCLCKFTDDEKNDIGRAVLTWVLGADGFPGQKYHNCKYMEFSKENLVEVVNSLLTEDQRLQFHLKAAKYLESSYIRCTSCGGKDTTELFGFNVETNYTQTENEEVAKRKKQVKDYENKIIDAKKRSKEKKNQTMQLKFATLRRNVYRGSSIQLGVIEVNILQALGAFKSKRNKNIFKSSCLCFAKKKQKKIIKNFELNEEMEDQRRNSELVRSIPKNKNKKEDKKDKDDKGSRDSKESREKERKIEEIKNKNREKKERNRKDNKRADSSTSTYETDIVDMRTCVCGQIQAEISVEIVNHYKKAEKFGRCLVNLMDAAESAISNGNSVDAILFIDEAKNMLRAIENKKIQAPDSLDFDDVTIDMKELDLQIQFMTGLVNFELGNYSASISSFIEALRCLDIFVPTEEHSIKKEVTSASYKFWKRHHYSLFGYRKIYNNRWETNSRWILKIRILFYLYLLFRGERYMLLALLMCLWQVELAEKYGNTIQEVIPTYTSLMESFSIFGKHRKAESVQNLALKFIKSKFDSKEQLEIFGLLTTANLFLSVAYSRLLRGNISGCSQSANLALQITHCLHDNNLCYLAYPILIDSLVCKLKIADCVDELNKLWYRAEEDEDWVGLSTYYFLSLELLLNTCYPIQPFYKCEDFFNNESWSKDIEMYGEFELKYNIQITMALWYARYSYWSSASKWLKLAEIQPKIKHYSFLVLQAKLKLLECQLIILNGYITQKEFQEFGVLSYKLRELISLLKSKLFKAPVLYPRFYHLLGYYYRIRRQKLKSKRYLKKAESIAVSHGNVLEREWINQSRMVWSGNADKIMKNFWLEHTKEHELDWHISDKIPWYNIMYALPIAF